MGLRTFAQLTFEVDREVADPIKRATTFEVQQAINDSYREIVQFCDWTFLVDRVDIAIKPAYNTGTVTVTDGSTTVTGALTNWNTGWFNKKILIAGDATEKEIAVVNNATTLTLRYPYTVTTTTTTGLSYQIFQDIYPVNISHSRDIAVLNPKFQWSRLTKFDRYTFDDRTAFNRFATALRPEVYTDAGADPFPTSPTYNQPRFQFWPFPSSAQDLVMMYYRTPVALSAATDTTLLPAEYEEILIRLAKYRIKRRYGLPGWTDDKAEAYRFMVGMREKQKTSLGYDFNLRGPFFPYADPYAVDQSLGFFPGNII